MEFHQSWSEGLLRCSKRSAMQKKTNSKTDQSNASINKWDLRLVLKVSNLWPNLECVTNYYIKDLGNNAVCERVEAYMYQSTARSQIFLVFFFIRVWKLHFLAHYIYNYYHHHQWFIIIIIIILHLYLCVLFLNLLRDIWYCVPHLQNRGARWGDMSPCPPWICAHGINHSKLVRVVKQRRPFAIETAPPQFFIHSSNQCLVIICTN